VCNDFGAQINGAKGVPEAMFEKAREMGIAKINVDTDLRLAFTGAIRKYFIENPNDFDPRKYLGPARDAVREVVKRKIKIFGTDGKA
jgi:fructose-bisphosphate aldolase class II